MAQGVDPKRLRLALCDKIRDASLEFILSEAEGPSMTSETFCEL